MPCNSAVHIELAIRVCLDEDVLTTNVADIIHSINLEVPLEKNSCWTNLNYCLANNLSQHDEHTSIEQHPMMSLIDLS